MESGYIRRHLSAYFPPSTSSRHSHLILLTTPHLTAATMKLFIAIPVSAYLLLLLSYTIPAASALPVSQSVRSIEGKYGAASSLDLRSLTFALDDPLVSAASAIRPRTDAALLERGEDCHPYVQAPPASFSAPSHSPLSPQ